MDAKRTVDVRPRVWYSWAAVCGWMLFIFLSSSVPGKDIPRLVPQQDVLYHGVIYAILGLFLYRALTRSVAGIPWPVLVVAATVVGTFFGASDEFHQTFVSGRTASLKDLVVDGIGTFLGACVKGFVSYGGSRTI